jgi:hypothetical protein
LPNAKNIQWYEVFLASDGYLGSIRDEHGGQEAPDSTTSSVSPGAIRDHLATMLPALQTERPFRDPYLTLDYGDESRRSFEQASVYVERWEKGRDEEGIWFFVALKPEQQIPTEEIEDYVWELDSYLEGLTEDHYAPQEKDDWSPWDDEDSEFN